MISVTLETLFQNLEAQQFNVCNALDSVLYHIAQHDHVLQNSAWPQDIHVLGM